MTSAQQHTTPNLPLQDNFELILKLLGNHIDDFKKSIDLTGLMSQLGSDTELGRQIKQMIEDPLNGINDNRKKIDAANHDIINLFVTNYLRNLDDIVEQAHLKVLPNSKLYYSIVLKEDTFENRLKISQFTTDYNNFEISDTYPVTLQITPLSVVSSVEHERQVI